MLTRTRGQTIVRCSGCGQVYHVPRSSEERRAKCRPCGTEFLIPIAVQHNDTKRQINPVRGAAADRYTAAQLAASVSPPVGRWGYRKKIAVAAALLMLGLCVFVVRGGDQSPDPIPVIPDSHTQPASDLSHVRASSRSLHQHRQEYKSVTDLIEAVEPSVVQIETSKGIGSGFVLDNSGLIVTCYHCIKDSVYATAVFSNGRRLEVRGTAAVAPECDVAILVVDPAGELLPLAPLTLADREIKKGERIVVIGSPAGLSFSESEGSVSSLRTAEQLTRLSSEFRMPPLQLAPKTSLVQITATTMPGNSGGPVVDFRGNVIGISSFGISWRDGHMYGFCVAASEIERVSSARTGKVRPLWASEVPEPVLTRFPGEKE